MPIQVPVTQTGLEASIDAAAKRAGKNLKINLGSSAKSIEGLSQPLGRITGKADQFTKSMEAANARVLAFGASVGVLSAVTRGFQDLVRTTIDVEKRLTSINSILGASANQLDSFKKTIFDVAKNTEQSFGVVADAALELSRQGLKTEEVVKRLNDSLVLSRLSGLGAAEAVAGLTAAINSFNSSGITSAEVLNKLSAAAVSAAVSERDLIEGIKRSGSVAIQAGVSFDELVGVITAVQTKTARGGAVIGNSFKTIFTRIQSLDKLQTMQNLGVEITDLSGNVLSGTKLIENLAKALSDVPDARRLQIAENLVGKFQVAPFLAILDDYNSKTSKAIEVTAISQKATTEAYERNKALNETLAAAINSTVVSVSELAETLGKIGVTDNLKGIISFFNNLVSGLQDILDGDGIGSKFAKGIVKGIGNVISGPGLAIFGAIIAKLTFDLAKFGVGSLNTFFGLNRAAKEQATLQGQIASTLLGNSNIQKQILTIENSQLSTEQKKAAQTKFFTTALNEQLAVMTRMQQISARVTPGVFAGTRGGRGRRAAGGFIPNYNSVLGYGSEQADINRGVGGAPSSAKPVAIPNFNFGGGRKGTMVANSSEFMVPNFAGTGGSAIFNQDMIASMGLPSGAKKVGAAGGYIPNFAKSKMPNRVDASSYFYLVPNMNVRGKPLGERTVDGQKIGGGIAYGLKRDQVAKVSDGEENLLSKNISSSIFKNTTAFIQKLKPLGRDVSQSQIQEGFDTTRGAKGALRGAIGAAFEVGITKALDYKAAIREKGGDFDVRGGINLDRVRQLFGFPFNQNTGDLKVGISPDNIISFYKKVIKERRAGAFGVKEKKANQRLLATQEVRRQRPDLFKAGSNTPLFQTRNQAETLIRERLPSIGRRFNFAGGYIPNFAAPLQEAIARESAAGLPVSQIRINQDASLRNSANPMGLAVTNTRDEPTGAIPNFAKTATPAQANDAMGGFVGKLLAVQIGFSALSGVLGQVTNQNKALTTGLTALNVAVSAAFAAQAFGGFKNIGKTVGFAALGGGRLGAAGQNLLSGGQANINRGFAANQLAGGGLAGRGQMARGTLQRGAGFAAGAVGPLVAASVAAVGIGAAFNALTGKTEALGKSQERVADSASKAAAVLGGLQADEDAKDRFIDSRAGAGADIATKFLDKTLVSGLFQEGKQFDNLSSAIDTALQRGTTESEIDKLLDGLKEETGTDFFNLKIGKGGGIGFGNITTVDSNELAELSKVISRLGEADLGKRFKDITEGLTEQQRQGLISGDAATIAQITKQTGEGGKTQLSQDAIKLLAADLKAGEAERQKTTEKEKQKRIDQIRSDVAKSQLSSEINLAKIRAEALSRDEIALKRNEFLNNLSEVQKQQIQQRISLKQIESDIDGKIADTLVKQIENIENLTLDSEKQTELRNKLAKLSLEELASQEKVKEVLGDIFDLSNRTEKEQEALRKGIDGGVAALRAERKLRKENLKLSSDVGISDAKRAEALAISLAAARRGNLNQSRIQEFGRGSELRDIALERAQLNPNLTPTARARAETGFVAREGNIAVQQAEEKAVNDTRAAIIELTKAYPTFEFQLKGLLTVLNDFGVGALGEVTETLGKIGRGEISGTKGPLKGDKGQKVLDAASDTLQADRDIETAKDIRDTNNEAAKAQERFADGFKSYMVLLTEFTTSLRQQAEQLKVDLITARDGAAILSNINEQLFTNQARGGGARGTANAATEAALTGLRDQAFLAGSSSEARGFTRQIDIVREQLTLKAKFVELQKDEVANEKELGILKQQILELEKQRLEVNDSLTAKLEDAFLFSEKDIQNKLTDNLVSGAREFATTIGDGMADAIAKGENLGDILRQAAADFFLQQAKSQFGAGLDRITSSFFNAGGPVVGGSGARDDVPALLTGGEYVMRKSAVQKFGPRFMEAINSGQIPAFNRGGLFTPGTFGQGAMRGKRSLLDFATQSFTTGAMDTISGGAGFASIALEPQSAALTMFGRRNSPQFQREQASKNKAFDLYKRQIDKEKQARESSSGLSSILKNSLLAFGVGSLFNMGTAGLGGKGSAPRGIPVNPDGTDMNFLQRLMLPFKRATGGAIPYAAGIDTVPTMLSGGEFVMNAAATQRVGRGTLSSINSGGGGGGNGEVIGRLDELISVSENSGETTINITVNSDGSSSEGGNGSEEETNLATRIRDVVKQVIDDEKRLGGSLRQARA
jgi:TP901 family phage tail tape measure protein